MQIKTKQCPAKSPDEAWANNMGYFVYILQSKRDLTYYTGVTSDIKLRLKEHNSGFVKYTSVKRPFVLKWYCVFTGKERAYRLEKYLKSHSGIAFRNKRLL